MVNNDIVDTFIFVTFCIILILFTLFFIITKIIYCKVKNKINNIKNLEIQKINNFFELQNEKNYLNNDCSICLEKFETNKCIILFCKHRYHRNCLQDYILQNQSNSFDCPLCRKKYQI